MPRRRTAGASAILGVTVVLACCGGKVTPPAPYGGTTDAGPTCVAAGARLCGGTCGALPDCPGGCVPLVMGDGSAAAYGVCFADLPDKGQTPCALCDTGQGCVQRSPGSFECVPLEVCDDLRKLGAGDVCWYGDKVPYDGRAIPGTASCPDSDPLLHQAHSMCGGACGPCNTANGALDRCVGQGPDHPVGICAQFCCLGNPENPASFPRCVVQGGFVTLPCPGVGNYTCAVYPSPPGEESVAKQNGLCLDRDVCHALHASLPGGLDCYD